MARRNKFAWQSGRGLLRLSWGALLVVATGATAGAQTVSRPGFDAPIAVGDTVQVDAPPGFPTLSRARIIELRPSSMVLRADSVAGAAVVPFEEVKWLAVRRGTRGHTVAGGIIGLAAGAVIGGAIYSIRNQKKGQLGSTISEYAVIGAGAGGVAGGIAGTAVRNDNWVPVIKGNGIEDFGLRENERVAPVD